MMTRYEEWTSDEVGSQNVGGVYNLFPLSRSVHLDAVDAILVVVKASELSSQRI